MDNEVLTIIITPAYSYDHDSNCDLDLEITFKIEELRGQVTEVSRWHMAAQLTESHIGAFLVWARDHRQLF